MLQSVLILIVSFFLSLVLCLIFIPLLKKLKVNQYILSYVSEHQIKNGTATMGGITFVFASVIALLIFGILKNRFVLVIAIISISYLCVGFLDDFLKLKKRENEGLKPYQKIIFQVLIAVISALFCYFNGVTEVFLIFSKIKIDLGFWCIPIYIFVFIATTNCVNLTDGLDGLASMSSLAFFISLFFIIFLQGTSMTTYAISKVCISLCGSLLAYLIFNTNKASVFMGDTGSMALGAFVSSCAIFSGNMLYISVIGIMFVISGISVIIQVLYYKKTKKRIFLMSPIHHHFQMKGYSEAKISYVYFLITLMLGLSSIIVYL